jgi:hypothetical protein
MIRLGWKYLTEANTLAYFGRTLFVMISFITLRKHSGLLRQALFGAKKIYYIEQTLANHAKHYL